MKLAAIRSTQCCCASKPGRTPGSSPFRSASRGRRARASVYLCLFIWPALEQIAYLRQQHLLARGRRRGRRVRGLEPLQAVHQSRDEEHHPGNDQKVERESEKISPGENCALLFGFGKRGRGHPAGKRDEIIG